VPLTCGPPSWPEPARPQLRDGTGLTIQLNTGRAKIAQPGCNDPTCTPHVVPAGSGFVDSGGDVQVVRNQGSIDLVTVVASLVPADAARRIHAPSPGTCPF
jgi:hypothetical protein